MMTVREYIRIGEVGDIIKCPNREEDYSVESIVPDYSIGVKGQQSGKTEIWDNLSYYSIEIVKEINNNKPMKLNSMMRRLLNADIKKLIKAGLMNGDLLLTDEGKNALYALLVEAHKKELVEIAKEIIAEKKEERE